MIRVEVKSELFDWALERARMDPEDAGARFPKLGDWRSGPLTLGFFFLTEPPEEAVPIPDFRTGLTSALRLTSCRRGTG